SADSRDFAENTMKISCRRGKLSLTTANGIFQPVLRILQIPDAKTHRRLSLRPPLPASSVSPEFGLRLRLRKLKVGRTDLPRSRPGGGTMLRTLTLAGAALLLAANTASADPLEGRWKTDSGAIAQIAGSGGGFTITLRSGAHNGKRIGQ